MNAEQATKVNTGAGFIAALDQSGGSTPKALMLYGIDQHRYSNEAEMFDLMHAMRTRIMTSPAFTGDKILGAILFEMTMDRAVEGMPTAQYLWEKKQVVPFLKIDKGLSESSDGVQVMKPITGLDELLDRACDHGIFGTKMRSVIGAANRTGIQQVVEQQFEYAHQIMTKGLVPIIEPEVDIKSPDKQESEVLLRGELERQLGELEGDQVVMLKLSIPSFDGFYGDLIDHPRVLRVVALSGGYSRPVANERLSRNPGMIASFSRALTEGLNAQQSDDEFNSRLANTIDEVYAASMT